MPISGIRLSFKGIHAFAHERLPVVGANRSNPRDPGVVAMEPNARAVRPDSDVSRSTIGAADAERGYLRFGKPD